MDFIKVVFGEFFKHGNYGEPSDELGLKTELDQIFRLDVF